MKAISLISVRAALLVVVMANISACETVSDLEWSAQTEPHECARLADRAEREACIDAAYRD